MISVSFVGLGKYSVFVPDLQPMNLKHRVDHMLLCDYKVAALPAERCKFHCMHAFLLYFYSTVNQNALCIISRSIPIHFFKDMLMSSRDFRIKKIIAYLKWKII